MRDRRSAAPVQPLLRLGCCFVFGVEGEGVGRVGRSGERRVMNTGDASPGGFAIANSHLVLSLFLLLSPSYRWWSLGLFGWCNPWSDPQTTLIVPLTWGYVPLVETSTPGVGCPHPEKDCIDPGQIGNRGRLSM